MEWGLSEECSHLTHLISLALTHTAALQEQMSLYPNEIEHHLTVAKELLRHETNLARLEFQACNTLALEPTAEEINADKWLLHGFRKTAEVEEEE